jgi:superfamily II DNA/RNA helicase
VVLDETDRMLDIGFFAGHGASWATVAHHAAVFSHLLT